MKGAKVKKSSAPQVSVITPVFNAEHVLSRTVASVQAQSLSDWEMILIEDGSSDGSLGVCEELAAQDPRIRLIRQPSNTGAASARNAGLRAVRGRYVAFLDSDDEWLPNKLRTQIDFMVSRKAVFSYSGFWRQTGELRHRVHVPATVTRDQLLKGNVVGCLTAVYDRAHFGDIQMPDLRMRQDFGCWLDLLERTDMGHGLDQPLAIHHVQAGSLSASRGGALRATWQLYHQHLGLSSVQSAWYLGHHLLGRLRRG